jgi:hypothetical protein
VSQHSSDYSAPSLRQGAIKQQTDQTEFERYQLQKQVDFNFLSCPAFVSIHCIRYGPFAWLWGPKPVAVGLILCAKLGLFNNDCNSLRPMQVAK